MMSGPYSSPQQLPKVEKEFKGISTGYKVLACILSILGTINLILLPVFYLTIFPDESYNPMNRMGMACLTVLFISFIIVLVPTLIIILLSRSMVVGPSGIVLKARGKKYLEEEWGRITAIRYRKPQPSLIIIPIFRFPEILITPRGGRVIEFRTIALSRKKIKEALDQMEPFCRYYGIELIRD